MHISRSLRNKDHSIRLSVTDHQRGWEVRQEEDSEIVRDVVCNDWHCVERAVSLFDHKARMLRQQGWIENGASPRERSSDATPRDTAPPKTTAA